MSFAFAEIPLIGYMLAPAIALAVIGRVPERLRARRASASTAALNAHGVVPSGGRSVKLGLGHRDG
jgi:hypothetical protein